MVDAAAAAAHPPVPSLWMCERWLESTGASVSARLCWIGARSRGTRASVVVPLIGPASTQSDSSFLCDATTMVMMMQLAASPCRASTLKCVTLRPTAFQRQQRAALHDLVIKRKTGQPIVSAGPYGGGR